MRLCVSELVFPTVILVKSDLKTQSQDKYFYSCSYNMRLCVSELVLWLLITLSPDFVAAQQQSLVIRKADFSRESTFLETKYHLQTFRIDEFPSQQDTASTIIDKGNTQISFTVFKNMNIYHETRVFFFVKQHNRRLLCASSRSEEQFFFYWICLFISDKMKTKKRLGLSSSRQNSVLQVFRRT